MQKAFNEQFQAEMYSSYLYLAMCACFEEMNLTGMSTWMRMQSQEEYGHAMKFLRHLLERQGHAELMTIDAPPSKWDSPLEIFEAAYAHEQKVTKMINDLMQKACEEKDHASVIFLQWFVTEQVEEEATASGIVEKLKLIGDSMNGLFMLDRALGARGQQQ